MAKAITKASSKPRAKRPTPDKAKSATGRNATSAAKKTASKTVAAAKATPKSVARKAPPKKASKSSAKATSASLKKATATPLKPTTKKTPARAAAASTASKTAARRPKPAVKAAVKTAQAAPKKSAPTPKKPAKTKALAPPPEKVTAAVPMPGKAGPTPAPTVPVQPAVKPVEQEKAATRKVFNLAEIELPPGYRPSPNEEYMSPMHLAYFKQKLERWREDLINESQETLEHLRTETRDVGDEAERASRESDNILELRTRDRYRKLLRKIEEAIKRIEDGSYGYCEETGEEIGLGRLEARPIATLTVDAQERREMFQKQFRDDR